MIRTMIRTYYDSQFGNVRNDEESSLSVNIAKQQTNNNSLSISLLNESTTSSYCNHIKMLISSTTESSNAAQLGELDRYLNEQCEVTFDVLNWWN